MSRVLWILSAVAVGAGFVALNRNGAQPRTRADHTPTKDTGSSSMRVQVVASKDVPLSVGEAFRRLIDTVRVLDDRKFDAAKAAAASLADFLARHPEALSLALSELASHDRSGDILTAGVLATALGMVADRNATLALLNALGQLTNVRVRSAAVRALGYNRYDLPRPPGGWTMSSTLVDVNTPIKESEVRSGILRIARDLLKKGDRASRTMLLDAIDVLTFSVDSDLSVARFMLDSAESADWPPARERAMHALSFSRDPAAIGFLQSILADPANADDLRVAATGLVRTGTPDNVRRVLDSLAGDEKTHQVAILRSLTSLRTRDPSIVALVEVKLSSYLADNSNPDLQAEAISPLKRLYLFGRSEIALDRVLYLVASPAASMQNRLSALRALHQVRRNDRERVLAKIREHVFNTKENLDLRVEALKTWSRLVMPEGSVEDLQELERLVRQSRGTIRDEARRTIDRLRRNQKAGVK